MTLTFIIIISLIITLIISFISYKINQKKQIQFNKNRIRYFRDISYIKQVINSCTNYIQLENSYNWAINYIKNYSKNDEFYFQYHLHEIKNLFQTIRCNLYKPTKQEIEYLLEQSENRNKVLRKGQWLFNELSKMYPSFANTIRGTEYDPFYDDNRINKFINYIYN